MIGLPKCVSVGWEGTGEIARTPKYISECDIKFHETIVRSTHISICDVILHKTISECDITRPQDD